MGKTLGYFTLGLLIGGGAASGAFLLWLRAVEERHQAEMAAVLAKEGLQFADKWVGIGGLVPGGNPANDGKAPKPVPTEKMILELAKAYIEDLEQFRFLRVYRATTPEFQKKFERKAFEEMVGKYKDLHNLSGENGSYRQMRLSKSVDGKGWDVYFTDSDRNTFGRKLLNIAMTLTPDGDQWRIDDLEIASSDKK